MNFLKKKLSRLLDLTVNKKFRIRWQYRRWQYWDRRADRFHLAALDARAAADRQRREGNLENAARQDRKATRRQVKADKARSFARIKVGRIKVLKRHVLKLDRLADKAREEIEKEKAKNRVTVHPAKNQVTGGSPKARFRAAALTSSKRCLTGKRVNFYDQSGSWNVDKVFTGEDYDERSDCSQWLTSVCKAANLPDPNGTNWTGGYTGTQVGGHNGWHQCSESELRAAGFGYVVYGTGTGFHVEAYVGPGDLTIGHGSAPIDPGVIDLLGDGNYRCFTLN